MTIEEIKKGLEKCTGVSCNGCPYNANYTTCTDRLKLDARELIIEQEQEIEKLKNEIERLTKECDKLLEEVQNAEDKSFPH